MLIQLFIEWNPTKHKIFGITRLSFGGPLYTVIKTVSVVSSADLTVCVVSSADLTMLSCCFLAAHFIQLSRPFPSFPPQTLQPLVQRFLHSSSVSSSLQNLQLPWEEIDDDVGCGCGESDLPFYLYIWRSLHSRCSLGQSCSSHISHRGCPETYLPRLFQRERQTKRTMFRTRGPACSSSGSKDWIE